MSGFFHYENKVIDSLIIEFLGTWESFYNPNFKVVVDHFKKEAGLHSFTMSVKNWIEKTNAIGIISKQGRYGGTYYFFLTIIFCNSNPNGSKG